MKKEHQDKQPGDKKQEPGNKDKQGVDKAPGEEQGREEKVTQKDLKGKQVDADPSTEEGKPVP